MNAKFLLNGKIKEVFYNFLNKIIKKVRLFLTKFQVSWETNKLLNKVVGCATDVAPAMIGAEKGFSGLFRKLNKKCTFIHFIAHRLQLGLTSLKEDDILL